MDLSDNLYRKYMQRTMCLSCGRPLRPGAVSCPKCGSETGVIPQAAPQFAAVQPQPVTVGSCPVCGAPRFAGTGFCEQCGTPFGKLNGEPAVHQIPEPEVKPAVKPVCRRCGEILEDGQIYCTGCGAYQGEEPQQKSEAVPFAHEPEPVFEKELPRAYITRVSTGERMLLDRSVTRIGKDKTNSDICIPDNSTVSRRHAEIINRDGMYYIRDMGSTNKTYVNGHELSPLEQTHIIDGDKIVLANEEFSFQIMQPVHI